ncbi:aspartate carbamoyltransferase regulatory subunit [Guggenheimella bovis]
MINVSGIENGIVIDHITAGKGIKIFSELGLDTMETPVVLLMGVKSNRQGQKDMIKIEGRHDVNLELIALIDEHVTISHIKDGVLVEKSTLTIPQEVEGLFECQNPRCITHVDSLATPHFKLKEANGTLRYQCQYCDEITEYKR